VAKIIIIIDDSLICLKSIGNVVRKLGYEVASFSNALDALVELKNNPDTDLVITDYMMPEMSGREFIEEIKKDGDLKHVPIILCSGITNTDEVRDLLSSKVQFILKPVNVEKLKTTIETFIDNNVV